MPIPPCLSTTAPGPARQAIRVASYPINQHRGFHCRVMSPSDRLITGSRRFVLLFPTMPSEPPTRRELWRNDQNTCRMRRFTTSLGSKCRLFFIKLHWIIGFHYSFKHRDWIHHLIGKPITEDYQFVSGKRWCLGPHQRQAVELRARRGRYWSYKFWAPIWSGKPLTGPRAPRTGQSSYFALSLWGSFGPADRQGKLRDLR